MNSATRRSSRFRSEFFDIAAQSDPRIRCRPSAGVASTACARRRAASKEGLGCVLPCEHSETRLFEFLARRLGRKQEADTRLPCPRYGVVRQAAGPGRDLLQGEIAAASEHPMHLGVEPLAVCDVHRRILRPHDIEARIRERHVEGTTVLVVDPTDEPRALGQHFGNADEFCGQIDAADPAAVMPGEIPRRPAEPGTDIEHSLGSGKADEFGEPHRRRALAAVKLVYRREIVRAQMVEVLASRFQRREDRLAEIGAGVVGLDGIVRHFPALSLFDRMALTAGAGRAAGLPLAKAPRLRPASLRAG